MAKVTVHSEPLDEAAGELQDGRREVSDYIAELYGRIDAVESDVQAWVDLKPRERVEAEAAVLAERYPDPEVRPSMYGVPVGVKDIFHVTGLPTRAGSTLPPGELTGRQAAVVTALREAGAVVLGKTVTTEFAYFEPGPTRNPNDLSHTPGGSSSGSAAAVAAGMCPLALGTQTIGSTVRPATFCGIVGLKPSYGRVPLDGVIDLAPSVDHVGLFTQDVPGVRRAVAACVDDWEPVEDTDKPVLGIPDGAYLAQATEVGIDCFEANIEKLKAAGYEVRRVKAFDDIEAVNDRHGTLVAAEAALTHHEWFGEYGDRYAESTAELIGDGRAVSVESLAEARRSRLILRDALDETASAHALDVWVSPGAPGPAPEGLRSTGDPVMNLPWTHAGLPAVSIPAGTYDGLPVGLQCVAQFGDDERLLAWAEGIANTVDGS